MNENANTAKWLRYLLYAGIAALVNTLLVNVSIFAGLSRWLGYAISGISVYLLYRLIADNARYKTAALFYGASLLIDILGIAALALAGAICAIVAQYQEYQAHSGLIADRDPRLANKWSSLFWLQFGVEVVVVLLTSVLGSAAILAGSLDAAVVTTLVTVIAAVISVILRLLYLRYLKRTIDLVENKTLE